MPTRMTGRSLLAWTAALSLCGCFLAASPIIRPSLPERFADIPAPAVSVTESIIDFPVWADLSGVLDTVNDERVIPHTFDHWEEPRKTLNGVDYSYYVEREDFSMNIVTPGYSLGPADAVPLRDWWKGIGSAGNILSVSAPVRYKIAAMSHSSAGGNPVQCGGGGEPLNEGVLNGGIALEMTPNYGILGSVTEASVHAVTPCTVRSAGVDVTREVYNFLSDSLRQGLEQSLARIASVTFRSQVEEVWNALHKPLPLAPDSWLQFNVTRIGHRGFSTTGRLVNDTIQLIAKPVVLREGEPPAEFSSLPPLDTTPPVRGFRVVTEVILDYAGLSDLLAERLRGERVAHHDNAIVITDASIGDIGGNRVAIRIDFRGDAQGHVYFIGKPQLNMLTQTLYFDGVYYSLESGRMLERFAEWLVRSEFRTVISTEAVLGVTSVTKKVRDLLAPVQNYRLSETLLLQGKLGSVQGIGVFADAKGVHVQVMAEGTLNVKALGGS